MKNYSLFILVLLSIRFCFGQIGYSKMYDFDLAASFHNVILKDDTLIIAGTARNEETSQWGALFVKMDTLGNVLDYQLHLDTMGGQYAFEKGYSIIPASDGGYLLLGLVHNREAFFIMKLNVNGILEHFWEYPKPPDNLTLLPRKVIQVHNGYIICSKLQESNGTTDVLITKINYDGEIIWENQYGDSNNSEAIGSVWIEDDNTIIIGVAKGTTQIARPAPNIFYCTQNWIFAIDSLGEVKWEWVSEPCEANNVIGLQPSSDGGWVYATSRLQVFDQWNLGFAPLFVKRDSEFNLVWERQLADSYNTLNQLIDVESEGTNWVGAGKWVLPEPYTGLEESYAYIPACLYKLTNDGDSLWIRCDTVTLENENSAGSHKYGGIVVLPSGSTVAVGSFSENLGGVGKSWAWVVKVDKDGCMEELCSITSVEDLDKQEEIVFDIFPNPTNGFLQIRTELDDYSVSIMSTDGIILKKWNDLSKGSSIRILEIERGTYFLEFRSKGRRWMKKIVKI